MKRISDSEFRGGFLGWQCRLRRLAARELGGRPTAGMAPRVSSRSGTVLVPAMIVLLVPRQPAEATAFFRFQVQRGNDPRRRAEAAIEYLGADYYRSPDPFSDALTAVFAPGSTTADALARERAVVLDFAQYGQRFGMFAGVKRLAAGMPARELSLWHNRLFNPDVPNDAEVLAFRPEWKSAVADPPLPG